MTLDEIIRSLDLKVITEGQDFSTISPQGGYASDLLSCVIAGAKNGDIWVTLQAHMNIVAVAALLDLSGVIISEGAQPDPATIAKANDQAVVLLSTSLPTYAVVGKLWEMGIKSR